MLNYYCMTILMINAVRAQITFTNVPCKTRSPKIVGGMDAEKHELPFIVSLTRRGGHLCGSTLIHEHWIITAGHCVCNGLNQFLQPTQIEGIVGLHTISEYWNGISSSKSGQYDPILVKFRNIIPHPQYECSKIKNDIALLKLLQPVQFSEHIQPTCLSIDAEYNTFDNEDVLVAGWGWTAENREEGERSDTLRKAVVKVWRNNDCQKSYHINGKPQNVILDTQMCAGYANGGIDSCWADSGGPLIARKNILIGIVSTGIGCARPGLPGIYTRVSKYISWIKEVMLKS